jgi:glycosyltransferase involved in cell wall biosynthesis
MLREPLFWYRRHDEGQSAKIMQDAASNGDTSGFLKEVRRNNPVAYGDMRLKDALKLLEDPNYAREAAERLPCYRKMKQYNDLEVEIGRILSDIETEYYSKHETRGRNQVAEIKLTHASQSIKPEEAILSPLNPLHHRFYTQSDAKMSIVILIPWMVMGGADLYDVSILQGLRNKERYHITIIVERNILTQSWLSRYQKIADEIFHLQIMTNSSSRQDEIIDYIVESRQTSLFINSRTIAGYRAFERWNEEKGGYFSTIKLVDILHLYHFNDRTNWEWRSGQAGKYTDARVVVSQDLARFMIDVVRYGDEELGNPSDPEDAYLWESLKQEPDGTYSSNTTRPILEKSEIDKFKVIYPPIDLPSSISSFPNHTRYWWSDAVDLSPRDVERRPTVFFLGRFDSQKDPLFWLDVVKEYYDLFKSLHQSSDPRFVMLGSGSLLYSIKQRLKSAEYSKIRPFLEIYPVEHTQVAIELAKQTNAIMLMTSRFEGVPITLLEAAALGIPSISLDCGGFKEVLQHESFWDTPLAKHAGKNVHRGQLASIIGYKCEGPIEHVPIARPKELAVFMARELRYWFDEMDSGSDVDQEIAARRKRWDSAARFRKEYGVGSFQAKWEALIYNLVSLH